MRATEGGQPARDKSTPAPHDDCRRRRACEIQDDDAIHGLYEAVLAADGRCELDAWDALELAGMAWRRRLRPADVAAWTADGPLSALVAGWGD